MNGRRDFPLLEAHLRNSVLVRSVERVALSAAAVFSYAAITRRVYSIRDRFTALPGAERLRGVAALVGTATVGHLVLLRFVPAHIAPALPKTFWLLIASAAVIVAVFADRFAASWPSSRLSGRPGSRR